jgi:hypothetical protein
LLPPLSRITEAGVLNFSESARLLSHWAAASAVPKVFEVIAKNDGEGALTAVFGEALGSPEK